MKRIIFFLAMLSCPSLFAATLTTNTVPYVCQGGSSPQLCNSNITTDNNGNAAIGLGPLQAINWGQVYQATTDGFLVGIPYTVNTRVSYSVNVGPTSGLGTTVASQGLYSGNNGGYTLSLFFCVPIQKGTYYEAVLQGQAQGGTLNFYPLGA